MTIGPARANKPKKKYNYDRLIETLLAGNGVWKAKPNQWRSACPVHQGDNVTSFSVYSDGGFRCFKCGASGDIIKLVMFTRRLSYKAACDYVGTAPEPRYDFSDIPGLVLRALGKPAVVEGPKESVLGAFRKNCPVYLINRGFSQASLLHYEIGYSLQECKVVIPVRDWQRKLVGLTYRTDFDDDKTQFAKYNHSLFSKSEHLYGFYHYADKPTRRLFLTEGQLDAVRMFQLGLPAAAIMGSDISLRQVDLLVTHCRAEQIVLAFDQDEAGEKATRGAIKLINKTRFGKNLAVLVYSGKDPGELTTTAGMKLRPWWRSLGRTVLET